MLSEGRDDDKWRETPQVIQHDYAGMTELTRGGRTWQLSGLGPDVRERLSAWADQALAQ